MIVVVEFLDHVEAGPSPAVCRVYGRLHHVGRECLTVTSWELVGETAAIQQENEGRFTIVRSAIKKVTHLVEGV